MKQRFLFLFLIFWGLNLGIFSNQTISGNPLSSEFQSQQKDIDATNLTVNNRPKAIGIDSGMPLFGWEIQGKNRFNVRQISYRICVASKESELDADRSPSDDDNLLWDSGVISSDQTQGIVYQGKPLESSTHYFWRVEIKTESKSQNSSNDSEFIIDQESSSSYFVTGIIHPEDWKAKWISMDRTNDDPLPFFKKEFELEQPKEKIDYAVLHICGLGHYSLWFNDRPLDSMPRRIDPGWTNYRQTCLYSTYQIDGKSDMIRDSSNKISVALGNGMFNVPGGRYVKYTGSFGLPKLICQMTIRYQDGSTQTVISDETWKAAFGLIDFSCVYGGEDWNFSRFDQSDISQDSVSQIQFSQADASQAKMFPENQKSAEKNVSAKIDSAAWIKDLNKMAIADSSKYLVEIEDWQDAILTESPGGVLRAEEQPPVVVIERMKPEAVSVLPNGQIEANFGFNFSGQPLVYCFVPKNKTIKITLAEMKEQPWNGHSYSLTGGKCSEESLIPFSPLFSYWGFQYLYIEGAKWIQDPEVQKILQEKNVKNVSSAAEIVDSPLIFQIQADYISSSAKDVGDFQSDGAWLNEIDQMVDRSVRSNLQSCITDCPHREKLGWLEQIHLMGPSIMYHYNIHTLLQKVCRDMTEAQLDDGMIPDIAPEYTRFSEGFFWSAEWSSAAVQIPYFLYRWYGDTKTLEHQYETMDRYVRFMAGTRNENGLVRAGLGDWYDWSLDKGHFGKGGYSQHTPGELTATAFLVSNAEIMAKVAQMLNKSDDFSFYSDLMNQAKNDFQKAYYNSETKVVATGSQASYAFALYFHLVPEEDRDAVLTNLMADIEKWEYRQSTGEVAFRFLIRSLADAGRSDVLWKMIQRENAPGYVHMLKHWGMKTLSETWDGPGSSMNHCMFGHIQEWFMANILGIGQTENSIGYSEILLRPEPMKNEIKTANGHFWSIRGKIVSDWNVNGTQFHWNFEIPGNATAVVQIPVVDEKSEYSIQMNGSKLNLNSDGSQEIGFEPSKNGNPARVILKLGSGYYQIDSTIYAD
ncbi:MAG: alpha-L-rhamnosidase N-terminal domain-containing protein [Planctomycetia bacterium]|nr:alpha-L-rhamnosidase N-terminal domain-containing protein [Planctomycetia bacterium]